MVELVDSSWLDEKLKGQSVHILDPRTSVKYLTGHIPGAVNLPMGNVLDQKTLALKPEAELSQILGNAGFDTDKPVVLYDNFDGQNAAMLSWVLEYLGHQGVKILSTRLDTWAVQGHELRYKPVTPTVTMFHAKPNEAVRASWKDIAKKGEERILDLRSRDEFQGKVATEVRTGRIPKALNLPWTSLIGEKETFLLPKQRLEENVLRIGVKPIEKIVTYCSYGPRAAVGYLALQQLGCKDVRVYDGSFHQWAQRAELPVEGEGLQLQL